MDEEHDFEIGEFYEDPFGQRVRVDMIARDAGGAHILCNWRDEKGVVNSRWWRPVELKP